MSAAVDGFGVPLIKSCASAGRLGRGWRGLLALGVVLVGGCLLGGVIAAPARAVTPGTVTNYTDPSISGPTDIVTGPDGALWFTNANNDSIGRITTSGAVTNYTGPGLSSPGNIVVGPDGALWFTNFSNNSIGRITTTGVITNYTGPNIDRPDGITVGPDGALWFTNLNNCSIGRITTAGVVTNYTNPGMGYATDIYSCPGISSPVDIAAGPDGALWFTNRFPVATIGRITTSGRITTYPSGGPVDYPSEITVGPDGALWYTNNAAGLSSSSIGRITTGGQITTYPGFPLIDAPWGITTGPDGALWFTNYLGNTIGRITTTGLVTAYSGPGISDPNGITTGPDGGLWFTNNGSNSIGRIQPYPASSSSFYDHMVRSDAPVSFWTLGERSGTAAVDQLGVNPGSYTGGVTLGVPGPITGTTAASFNGTTGHMVVPSSASLRTDDSFSLEAWIAPRKLGIENGILVKGRSANQRFGAYMFFLNGADRLELYLPDWGPIATSTTAISDTNHFHYVVVTKSATSVHIYLDGADVTGPVTDVTIHSSTGNVEIGAGAGPFRGAIADVAIYPYALTAQQVATHYAAATG